MQGLHIVATGRALPRKVVTNEELSKTVDTTDEWIRSRTGIGQRFFCEEENSLSLACEASAKAINKAKQTDINCVTEIGVVLVATSTPHMDFPSTACMVKEALGLPKEVIAFDISAACSGFLYGLRIAQGLLMTGEKKYALVVGAEQLSRIIDFSDRSSCVLFGDGAGAALITIDSSVFFHRALSKGDDQALWCMGVGNDGARLHMNGKDVFRFAVTVVPEEIDAILSEAKLSMEDIDYVVCHQANARIIAHVCKKYPGHEQKFYRNIEKYANTSAASIPIALDEMYERGMLKNGMKIICVGFGAGFTWSSALITI